MIIIYIMYVSLNFYLFLVVLLLVYYVLPLRWRWWVLLAGSIGFYYCVATDTFWIFAVMIMVSFGSC